FLHDALPISSTKRRRRTRSPAPAGLLIEEPPVSTSRATWRPAPFLSGRTGAAQERGSGPKGQGPADAGPLDGALIECESGRRGAPAVFYGPLRPVSAVAVAGRRSHRPRPGTRARRRSGPSSARGAPTASR